MRQLGITAIVMSAIIPESVNTVMVQGNVQHVTALGKFKGYGNKTNYRKD
jgi:hypothetical protein